MLDTSVFSRIKSKQDFDRERMAFEQAKQQRAMQKQMGQLQLQQLQKEVSAPQMPFQGNSWDAQIANEAYKFNIEKGLDPQSAKRAAVDMIMGSKSSTQMVRDEAGNVNFVQTPRNPIFGASTPMAQPQGQGMGSMQPLPRQMNVGSASPAPQFAGMGLEDIGNSFGVSDVQPAESLGLGDPYYMNSPKAQAAYAEAVAKNTAKKGDPEFIADNEAKKSAQARVTGNLNEIAAAYNRLKKLGGVVSYQNPTGENIKAAAKASGLGQSIGRAIGTEEQAVRDQVNQIRPTLINDIRQASEMGAKGMDSEKELEFFLQAATDPARDIETNMAAIQTLNNAYGLGASMNASPEKIAALRKEFEAQVNTTQDDIQFLLNKYAD